MVSKCRWSPALCASIALKIDKNGLEARKLQPFEIGGSFYKKFSIKKAHSLFSKLSKKIKILNITLLPLELQDDL